MYFLVPLENMKFLSKHPGNETSTYHANKDGVTNLVIFFFVSFCPLPQKIKLKELGEI